VGLARAASVFLAAVIVVSGDAVGQKKLPPVPDLVQTGIPEKCRDWNLGPTGLRGWMWGFEGQTTQARQIHRDRRRAGRPCRRGLPKGDVIVGIAGKPFDGDARLQLAAAISAAEEPRQEGRLKLLRRRGNKTDMVVLKLAVVGGFAQTAPYECAKSKRLLDSACRAIVARGFHDKRKRIVVSIENDMNALLLLASGDRDHLPLVADYAKAVAASQPGGHIAWGYAYRNALPRGICARDARPIGHARVEATCDGHCRRAIGSSALGATRFGAFPKEICTATAT
jgi:hypothetical protein